MAEYSPGEERYSSGMKILLYHRHRGDAASIKQKPSAGVHAADRASHARKPP
jgi:hypothetical protein